MSTVYYNNFPPEHSRNLRKTRHRCKLFVGRKLDAGNFTLSYLVNLFFILYILNSINLTSCQEPEAGTTTSTNPKDQTSWSKLDEFRAKEALNHIKDWSDRFGRDIYYGTQETTCFRSIRDHYDPSKSDRSRLGDYRASIVSIDWTRLHNEIVDTISTTMGWHKQAVENIAREAEFSAGNYSFQKNLTFDYVDVHRLKDFEEDEDQTSSASTFYQPPSYPDEQNNSTMDDLMSPPEMGQEVGQLDSDGRMMVNGNGLVETRGGSMGEQLPQPAKLVINNLETQLILNESTTTSVSGEWQTPIKYLKMSRHRNFGEVPINLEESAVHIPVHIFPGSHDVINGIAWSDSLTKVFKDNFVRNPKLTNQYFASQFGFMRLYPAQKWQIARTDPDLYDARMRPWYVAGASSRKDVIILVDSSGSMTGSRRDIAKGVVFEILDTLTDNDHFLIMKFSDSVQQVGVPSCSGMRTRRPKSSIPLKNTMFGHEQFLRRTSGGSESADSAHKTTDIDSLYLLPATGKNVRQIKTNFTIPTSGIANFSEALTSAFEVLRNYQDGEQQTSGASSQCNQAIMLITDGSPSDFEEIFNRYNYPNAPVRVFTYLIGREAGDVSHTKMMACHNRGYYTHVINLAEVRETVQQYIPVMARPLVLNGSHPITWTPAYGELTYQILTDWIWESKRREKARAILAAAGRGAPSTEQRAMGSSNVKITSSQSDENDLWPESGGADLDPTNGYDSSGAENEANEFLQAENGPDLFGYQENNDCFWQTHRNDLLTTVVQPVYDKKRESSVTEKYLVKNVWTIKETIMRTAQILGVAAADMKINDIVAMAPSHKLGPNGYSIMLTNNGYAMHHPDLRSILEPFNANDPIERAMKILKPFFSSMDLAQVEHILSNGGNSSSDGSDFAQFLALRKEAISGLTGWRELLTKRAVDCQKRVQSRRQSFYFKPIQQFPSYSYMVAIPQPYGSHRIEAQVEIKLASLPEKLTTYFTTSEYDLWTIHPDYSYCDGPSNNSITTILDVLQRIENNKFDDIQWRAAESTKPPLFVPHKIVCDKDLLQSMVYDAVATFGFSENCGPQSPSAESNLLGMLGVRFAFVSTRNGLTKVRHFDTNDRLIKREALAFAKNYARGVDETFYSRTVDYNMLINGTATLVQVPFNTHETIRQCLNRFELEKISNSSSNGTNPRTATTSDFHQPVSKLDLREQLEILKNNSIHLIATQTILVNEGFQRAAAGVSGVFYDYGTFVERFFNLTNNQFSEGAKSRTKPAQCYSENPIDEICDESKTSIKCGYSNDTIDCLLIDNNGYIVVSEDLNFIGRHLKVYEPAILNSLVKASVFHEVEVTDYQAVCMKQDDSSSSGNQFSPNNIQQPPQPILSLLPNKTYLRPCEKTLTLYETRFSKQRHSSESVEHYSSGCNCKAWFVYEQVPQTNLIMLIVDSDPSCRRNCFLENQTNNAVSDSMVDLESIKYSNTEEQVCSMFERESQLFKKKMGSCFAHHADEDQIKICGGSGKSTEIFGSLLIIMIIISLLINSYFSS